MALPENIAVRFHTKCGQCLNDVLSSADNGTCLVNILNAYQPAAVVRPRIKITRDSRD
jgi:hypothetical protein